MKKFILYIFIAAIGLQNGAAQNFVSVNYSVGIPSADLKEYISNTSPRGMSLEFVRALSDEFAMSFNLGWNVFYKEVDYDTYTEGTVSISGHHYRYTNSVPLHASALYYLDINETIYPFAGIGLGTTYLRRDTQIGQFTFGPETWQFSLKPELGVMVYASDEFGIKVAAKYYQNFKNSHLESQSYLAIDIGLMFFAGY